MECPDWLRTNREINVILFHLCKKHTKNLAGFALLKKTQPGSHVILSPLNSQIISMFLVTSTESVALNHGYYTKSDGGTRSPLTDQINSLCFCSAWENDMCFFDRCLPSEVGFSESPCENRDKITTVRSEVDHFPSECFGTPDTVSKLVVVCW